MKLVIDLYLQISFRNKWITCLFVAFQYLLVIQHIEMLIIVLDFKTTLPASVVKDILLHRTMKRKES